MRRPFQKPNSFILTIFTTLVFFAAIADGADLSGSLTDVAAGTPIANAVVWLEGTAYKDTTDSGGKYFISNIPAGSYTVIVAAENYQQKVISGFQVSDVVPVELANFSARLEGSHIVLQWRTNSESANMGFEIYRRDSGKSDFGKIGWVPGAGSTSTLRLYSFADFETETGKNYFYKLKQIDYNGKSEWSDEIELRVPVPSTILLEQNYPNPFNPTTTIRYQLPRKTKVMISVFNIEGKQVDILINKAQQPGEHSVTWNGRDRYGSQLPSGIYFLQLRADNFQQVRKMTLLE
ncbi:MAG: T9SS type A sorting domain-containing protein [Calditrichaeota bacterium]|nr:T9SS type A sorting domain-containing protein [Calditrichota bacterium]